MNTVIIETHCQINCYCKLIFQLTLISKFIIFFVIISLFIIVNFDIHIISLETGKFLFSIVNAQRMHSAPGATLTGGEQVSEEATSTVS